MSRTSSIAYRTTLAALAALVVLALPVAGALKPPVDPPPTPPLSPNTVIRSAPAQICALLDDSTARGLMDGLLFNLLWSCGRQNELGPFQPEPEPEPIPRIDDRATTASDVQVNNSTGETGASATQSETSIAQNPVTGTLCSSFNDSWEYYGSTGGGGFTGFARSTDNGATWQDGGAVGGISMGDPSVVWRRADGRFYLATLASGGSLAVWVSNDDCQSFSFLSTPSTSGDDKELLAADNNQSSPYYGNLYLVWTDFGVAGYPIRATRSTDGGVSWWTPTTVSTGGTVQGAWPAVAPNGNVFVAWLEYANFINGPITIRVSRSTNGGASYGAVTAPLVSAVSPRQASATSYCGRPALNGHIRYLASPQIAVDDAGTLHVVYSYDPDGYNTGDVVNVYYRRSTNNGSTWSPEVRLNDDTTLRDQYFPTLKVDGSTVMATWYDRRLDSSNLLQDTYKRISTDGGLTWQPSVRVSDVSTSIVLDPYLAFCYHGDYDQTMVATTNEELAQWADDRRGDADVWSDPATDTYRCVVDLDAGTNTCTGAISLTSSSGIYRTGRIDLAGGYQRLDAVVDVCSPTGYTLHIADSPTCDGWGGDAGTTNHNAEVQINGTGIYTFGTDERGTTEPGTLETGVLPASGCYRVHWTIQEDKIRFDDDGNLSDSSRISLDSYHGFEIAPYAETDTEDPNGYDANLWYFGLNRTVYSAARSGTGVHRACLVLSRTTSPNLAYLERLCN
jgi:hypothetical protein